APVTIYLSTGFTAITEGRTSSGRGSSERLHQSKSQEPCSHSYGFFNCN
ncbi:unnamed protein product, partial [Allacma fusca]